ncbi:hypothetical protein F5Y10DRAFT_241400 [Nemania abortiva]|nr:hypothetical protein F5Y10DRAFT_241400 [Nemania abortiva]
MRMQVSCLHLLPTWSTYMSVGGVFWQPHYIQYSIVHERRLSCPLHDVVMSLTIARRHGRARERDETKEATERLRLYLP